MNEILNRIEIYFQKYLPEMLDTLNPRATASEIEAVENQLGIEFPLSFKELYKWHNGQIKGSYLRLFDELEFLSLNEILINWRLWAELVDNGINDDLSGESYIPGKVKKMYANKKWIPFAFDGFANYVGIDLDPGEQGKVEQVISFGIDEYFKFVFADDFETFLGWFVTQIELGNHKIFCRTRINTNSSDGIRNFLSYWKALFPQKFRSEFNEF
ncbi:SMI1/KNR4 family protein [Nostoc sp.]|uniref:SMI1/KNR4 family protein n=1 Tax=Nostoc sp. TaxID=1180 RepID=UPI002FFD1C3B